MDKRPKFHLYKPNIAILSGIAWDHINVFPTFENYVDQFRKFIDLIQPEAASCIARWIKCLKMSAKQLRIPGFQ